MQTLALQLTTTFVDDAIELVKGFGRVMFDLATAPIERIARACDVAGVLEQRRAGSARAAPGGCRRRPLQVAQLPLVAVPRSGAN